MQDETKSTSPDTPRNAFHPDFLRRRHDREDEPLAALEAESRGPWIVVESTAPVRGAGATQKNRERYEIYRSWEDPETDEPAATFRFREQAYLYAAALEVGARGSVLTVGREPTERGYEVIQWDIQGRPEVVGHIPVFDEDLRKQKKRASQVARLLFYALQRYGLFHAYHCRPPNHSFGMEISGFDECQYLKSQLGGSSGLSRLHRFCYLHDPLAAWVMLHPNLPNSCWREATIRIETMDGQSRGRVIDCSPKLTRGAVSAPQIGTNVKWLSFDVEEAASVGSFRTDFLERLGEVLYLRRR